MKEYNTVIQSKCDDLMLYCHIVEPDNIKAIFQIAHGMAEPKERYYDFMRFLANNGYLCVINDHRGHGKSLKTKEDLGYFYDESGTYVVEDIHDIGMKYKEEYNVPYYLFGHSMGSLIVREVLKKYDKDIDKLIVCGSPSENAGAVAAIGMCYTLKAIKGDHYRSDLINNLALGGYQKRFNESIPNTWLSYNRENVRAYNNNEYCGFTFTINGFLNLFHLMVDVYDKKNWKCENLNIPIYFIAGDHDPCIDTKEKWIQSQNFLRALGYNNIENTLYTQMRHEILQETQHDLVYRDILNFLDK